VRAARAIGLVAGRRSHRPAPGSPRARSSTAGFQTPALESLASLRDASADAPSGRIETAAPRHEEAEPRRGPRTPRRGPRTPRRLQAADGTSETRPRTPRRRRIAATTAGRRTGHLASRGDDVDALGLGGAAGGSLGLGGAAGGLSSSGSARPAGHARSASRPPRRSRRCALRVRALRTPARPQLPSRRAVAARIRLRPHLRRF